MRQPASRITVYCRLSVDRLFRSQSVAIILILDARPALAHPSQFSPASPRIRPYPVVQRVPYPVSRDRPPIVARQLVVPLVIVISIRNRLLRCPQRSRRIRIFALLPDISSCVVLPRPALPQSFVVLPRQLPRLVVAVPRVVPSPRVVRDLPVAIVSR